MTEPTTEAGRDLLAWRGQHGKWTEQRWVDAILAIEAEAREDQARYDKELFGAPEDRARLAAESSDD